jgi:hypothetical protein
MRVASVRSCSCLVVRFEVRIRGGCPYDGIGALIEFRRFMSMARDTSQAECRDLHDVPAPRPERLAEKGLSRRVFRGCRRYRRG